MRKLLVIVAVLLVVGIVCAGTVKAKELHVCDFCGTSDVGDRWRDAKYTVLCDGDDPEFCSKACITAYYSGYKPADTEIEARIVVPASSTPICFCWWCRLTRWLGFDAKVETAGLYIKGKTQ